jgi:hypothetical protein
VETLSLGKHNPKLIDIRKALDQGTLTREGLLPVEGPKLLEEAQRSGLANVSVFKRRDAAIPEISSTVPVYAVDPAVFKSIQSTETSQGVIALVRPQQYNRPTSSPATHRPSRTPAGSGQRWNDSRGAESFGCRVIATTETASVLNQSRTCKRWQYVSHAALWDVDLSRHCGPEEIESRCRNVSIGSRHHRLVGLAKAITILIGNEGQGLIRR